VQIPRFARDDVSDEWFLNPAAVAQPKRRKREARSLGEELDCFGRRERRHEPRGLARDAECFTARCEYGEPGAAAQKCFRHWRARLDDMLAVVENDQRTFGVQRLDEEIQRCDRRSIVDMQRGRDLLRYELAIRDRCEVHPTHAREGRC